MAADQDAQGRLTGVVRRHLKLVGAVTGAATLLGAAAGLLLPASAQATATVLVTPLDGNPYSTNARGDDLTNLETEAQLVGADAVEQVVRRKLRGADRTKVSATVPPNTQVLVVTYKSGSATDARDGAQAFADGYLEYRKERAQDILNQRAAKLRDQEKKVQQSLETTVNRLATASSSQKALLRQQQTAYTSQLSVIQEQTNDIAATPVNPGSVISPAQPPSGSLITRAAMYGGAGLAVGLLASVLAGIALERSDRRLRDARAVQRLGIPVLSTVPAGNGLVLVTAPKSKASEAYRKLRAAVVASVQERPVTLLVTSATPAASATLAGSNLAVALAHAGSPTIMIDAGFSETSASALFGLGNSKGLSDVLMRGTDPTQLLVHADSQLRLLPRGPGAGAAAERFSGPRMREAVGTLREKADYVLINAPSVHDANAQALCTLADAVLIVVTLGQTTRADIDQAYTEAERAGAVVIGTVIEGGRSRRPAAPSGPPTAAHRAGQRPGQPEPPREAEYAPGAASGARELPAGAAQPPAAPPRPGTHGTPGAPVKQQGRPGAPSTFGGAPVPARRSPAPGRPAENNTLTTSPDWSRFADPEAAQPAEIDDNHPDSKETAVHKAIDISTTAGNDREPRG